MNTPNFHSNLSESKTYLLQRLSSKQIEKLEKYENLLKTWQKNINLVANSTIDNIWQRHFADSFQLIDVAAQVLDTNITHWLDLGSGAGFPGLVIAVALFDVEDALVELIESDERKVAFLRTVARELNLNVKIHCGRIEKVLPQITQVPQIVSARALAALPKLIDMCEIFLAKGAIGIFPQGEKTLQITDSTEKLFSEKQFSCSFYETIDAHYSKSKVAIVRKI